MDYSGLALVLIPVEQTNASYWVYGVQILAWLYTIAMVASASYSLFRHFKSPE
jgi:acyl-CoA hydrolase